MAGFFKTFRSMLDHWIWQSDEPFDKRSAWLDLVASAQYEPSKRTVQGKLISLKVGELIASERYLVDRWKWSRTKVRTFIQLLEKDHMLTKRKDQGQTILSLSNYGKYQKLKTKKDTSRDTSDQTKGEPPSIPAENQRKEVKKREEGKELPPKSPKGESLPYGSKFGEAWERWKQHRKEARKKLTPTTIKSQLKKLSEMGEERAIAALNHSTENGYQGIFEPNTQSPTSPGGGRNVGNLNGKADASDFELASN